MRRWRAGPAALLTLAVVRRAHADDAALFSSAALPQFELNWHWVAGAAALGLAVGFALGWQMLARRIRRKFGGLKIY